MLHSAPLSVNDTYGKQYEEKKVQSGEKQNEWKKEKDWEDCFYVVLSTNSYLYVKYTALPF